MGYQPNQNPLILLNSLVIDLKKLANSTISNKGFEVIAVELQTHLNPMSINLKIRAEDGEDVSIDDCALLSSPIGEAFEKSELLFKPYILEISSPGISEVLENDRDFETFKGFPVKVDYFNETSTELHKKGLLHEKSNNELKINCKGRMTIIPLKSVLKVQLTNP